MKKFSQLLTAAVLTAASTSALAESSGWYLGIGGGQSTTQDWLTKGDMVSVLDAALYSELATSGVYLLDFDGVVRADSDDQDSAFKIFGGYQFNDYIGLEFSYMDLGEATASASADGTFFFSAGGGYGSFSAVTSASASVAAEAFSADAVFRLPLSDMFNLFAKAGVYRAELEAEISVAFTPAGGATGRETITMNDDSYGLHAGLGVGVNLTPHIALRAEWERLLDVELEGDKADLDLLSASVQYLF